jgi:hypothetical protein
VPYHGWTIAGGDWTLSGAQADLDGLFYATGDVNIKGGKQEISMSVLCESNICFSGNGKYTPYYDCLFLVSLMDIQISGTPSETGDVGVIMAREQIEISGNTFIRGVIMAADLDDASNNITSTLVEENTIMGNVEIEYNGGYTTSFPIYDPNSNKYKLDPVLSAYEER